MYILFHLHRKFNRLKLLTRIAIIFILCTLLILPNFILFASLEDQIVETVHEEVPFINYSIITLLRGPTEKLLKSNPDTYHFELNSLRSYLRLLPPERIFALIDNGSQCPEIIEKVGSIRCLEIPCR
jgi:predicted PurR-regulated permease PerM